MLHSQQNKKETQQLVRDNVWQMFLLPTTLGWEETPAPLPARAASTVSQK
jgi:hypothetical protein